MISTKTPYLIRLSNQVYRVLLYLYPQRHRHEYGEMMADMFDDMCQTAYRQHRNIGIARLWLRTLKDTAIAAIIEHTERRGDSTMPITKQLVSGQLTDTGKLRPLNQDATYSRHFAPVSENDPTEHGLFIVADGLGGYEGGERASALAIQTISTAYANRDTDDPILNALEDAVLVAHEAIKEQIPEAGTCVTAVVIMGNKGFIAHVGDTRAYSITPDGVKQLTKDHSVIQRLIDLGELTTEEAAEHRLANVIYRSLGKVDHLEVDIDVHHLPAHSRLLICSDGLWRLISIAEIQDIALSHHDPQEACDTLIALANERGGDDNITALLVQIPAD
jgi:protein phosphatase